MNASYLLKILQLKEKYTRRYFYITLKGNNKGPNVFSQTIHNIFIIQSVIELNSNNEIFFIHYAV